MDPGSPLQTLPLSISLLKVSVPARGSLNLTFLGKTPPTSTLAPRRKLPPVISSRNTPEDSRPSLQPVRRGDSSGNMGGLSQLKVTWTPCSLPGGQFGGAPAGKIVKFLLVPFGPLTKSKKVLPAFVEVKSNRASIKFGLSKANDLACTTLFGFPRSTANTDVTFGVSLIMKHEPLINKSCGIAQSPVDGVAENTTGARIPKSIGQVVVLVNGPKMLLSPDEKDVLTTIEPTPPQQAGGKAVPGKFGSVGKVPVIRLLLTGVTSVNGMVVSGKPSPFVSHVTATNVITVLQGR
jgi:hypothetical protein